MNASPGEWLVADRIDDLASPAQTFDLIGHRQPINHLAAQYASGRMHHAWLLNGPKGIGKATLAFRFAGHLFRNIDATKAPNIYVAPDKGDGVESRVAGGGHPNLLHLSRPWDEKQKKFKTELTVDEIRRTISFFGKTRGEMGWRVCIVDAADEMNDNAANALLKILEEPPSNTLFLVISHASGRLLATIRSRCQLLTVKPLSEDEVIKIADNLGLLKDVEPQDRQLVATLSAGSPRRAAILLRNEGISLYRRLEKLCTSLDQPEWSAIHSIASELAPRAKDEKFRLFMDLVYDFISRQTLPEANSQRSISKLARWSQVWEKTRQSASLTDSYNLDRKQMILSLFERMHQAA